MAKSIFEDVLEHGIEFDNHCSDLYIPVNDVTRELIKNHPECKPVSMFHNQASSNKELWYDLAFQYPFYNLHKINDESALNNWRVVKRPDSSYGMSYPYEFVYMGENCILEKFPFSDYMGKFNGYSCIIADITSHESDKEYSLQIYKNSDMIYFKRELKSLQSAYVAFCYYTHKNKKL